ncbi:MAG TPA: 1-acyl-sn-glycerol-3-phosphate acyltransferase [Archangium sp.]|uniref:1-acyl-sn-glycerol-3-phosphate acyltransferase n=1 Tax=Archangium sp. TaxID=1872627 RepID=UPI002E35EB0A|nr:1-acyl-sn-glycerol-3-phosphate acyltransferase [Archangium sp.]HEX5748965.1 1-acyl-sn-glycerol-3-phosphate acyltransferase [Archangium sp.]
MAKGVLGNDPFQRGAAQRPGEARTAGTAAPEPKKAQATPPPTKANGKSAPAKAAKKAPAAKAAAPKPAPKPVAEKAAAPKPASGARGKKATAPQGKAPKTPAAPPSPEVRTPPEAVRAAGAPVGTPVEPPVTPASARDEVRASAEAPREATASARSEAAEVDAELLERAAEAVSAVEALRELEEAIGEALPTGPVAVPGFEDTVEVTVTETVAVEVLDASQDEYAPDSEAEAAKEARIEVQVEAALAPVQPAVSSNADAFFTAESPGAEPHRLGDRFAGLFSLAKEAAFQALASEGFGKTMGSAQGLVSAALTSIGMGGGTAIDEYGKDAALGGVMQPVLDFLYERYWRVSVQGASHVPAGPVLLVANHSGALPIDGPVLQQALSRERPDLQEARWLAEDQVFHAPMLGTLMNRLGAVRACPENALRLLDELRPVIVFPEGIQGLSKPFAQRYQLKRFGRGGFVKLALRTGAPIIPVAIVGAEETVPLFGKLPAGFLGLPYLPLTPPPLPARWTIRFGDPISMGELPPEAADDMSQVQRLTERTRESIQGMLQALLKERRSVFAG